MILFVTVRIGQNLLNEVPVESPFLADFTNYCLTSYMIASLKVLANEKFLGENEVEGVIKLFFTFLFSFFTFLSAFFQTAESLSTVSSLSNAITFYESRFT